MAATFPPSPRASRRSALPGFGLGFGVTLFWLALVVLIPVATAFLKTFELGWREFWEVGFNGRALAAYRLSFGTAIAAAAINAGVGLLIAWVLARYRFAGRELASMLVDLPFALPPAVTGIALTTLYSPQGWIGGLLARAGLKVVFTPVGIVIALVFVGLPFVVRSVEPVLADLGRDVEEAAATLGASRWQTFRKVIFPAITSALVTGFAMAFARGVGEYGSVIFISGNMPGKTEIAPLLIVTELEQYATSAATAIAVVMMLVSFAVLLAINGMQAASRARFGA